MASDFYWKRHDTAPTIQVQLKDSAGNPVDVTGGTVKFLMKGTGGAPKVNASGTLVTPASGIVSYTPIAADTDTSGTYSVEWVITFAGGAKQSFPDPGYNSLTVTDDLDDA